MINKVILIGNVGKDPEVRHFDNNLTQARFPVATSETYTKANGEKVTNTDWHNIVVWRGLADVAQKYVKKGMQVYIEGKIRNRSYDDKDGNKRYSTDIEVEVLKMLSRPSDSSSTAAPSAGTMGVSEYAPSSDFAPGNPTTDDLPF
jgi:single-strand DNA-binding protein